MCIHPLHVTHPSRVCTVRRNGRNGKTDAQLNDGMVEFFSLELQFKILIVLIKPSYPYAKSVITIDISCTMPTKKLHSETINHRWGTVLR